MIYINISTYRVTVTICFTLNIHALQSNHIIFFFRHAVARAREIFRFTSSREENAKDRNRNNVNTGDAPLHNAYLLRKEDMSSEPLFEQRHLLAYQQPSNESTSSTKKSDDTVSIAISNL